MRILIFLLFVSMSSAIAQTATKDLLRYDPYTAWQIGEWSAHTQKCFDERGEKLRNQVTLTAKIGPDGLIIGDPEIRHPIDTD
jgi:hypothetical protein